MLVEVWINLRYAKAVWPLWPRLHEDSRLRLQLIGRFGNDFLRFFLWRLVVLSVCQMVEWSRARGGLQYSGILEGDIRRRLGDPACAVARLATSRNNQSFELTMFYQI